MRLYNTRGATSHTHSDGTVYEPDEHGHFDFPHDVALEVVRRPHWEAVTEEPQETENSELRRRIAELEKQLGAALGDPPSDAPPTKKATPKT